MDSNMSMNTEDDSIAILSPPLSPYPKQVPLATSGPYNSRPPLKPSTSFLHAFAASADSGVQTPVADERDDSPAPTVDFNDGGSTQEFGDYLPTAAAAAPVSTPRSSIVPSKVVKSSAASSLPSSKLASNTWSLYKKSPVNYFKRERALLALYPTNGPTWANYVYVEGTSETASRVAAATVAVLRPGKVRKEQTSANDGPVVRRSRRGAAAVVSGVSAASSDNDSDVSTSSMLTRSALKGRGQRFSRDSTPLLATAASAALVARQQQQQQQHVSSSKAPSRPSTPRPRQVGAIKSRSHTASPAPSRVHELSSSQLVDYSPSADNLPAGKSLRAEWKGAPMDLSTDPNVGLLHAAEIHLASVLRLPADVYLDSKRRLFAEKVHRLKHGLPFRRTDSQKACRIDVNKASRLYSAFEKVGWLEDKHFTKFV